MGVLQRQLKNKQTLQLIETCLQMFSETSGKTKAVFPARHFQKAILYVALTHRYTLVQSPSQSGKTISMGMIALIVAMIFPGANIGILSATEDQAKRILDEIKMRMLTSLPPEFRPKLLIDNAECLRLGLTVTNSDGTTHAEYSTISAYAHSLKAVTGNAFDLIILDELSKWEKDPEVIYTEAISRLGDTEGTLLGCSTFDGGYQPDKTNPKGYRGSFFAMQHCKMMTNPSKDEAALTFTHHVSPILTKDSNIKSLESAQKTASGMFLEKYWGIPRLAIGQSVFGDVFKPKIHIETHAKLISECPTSIPLFVSVDPGGNFGYVIGQYNPDIGRVTILASGIVNHSGTTESMKVVLALFNKLYKPHGYRATYYADVAANAANPQTQVSDATQIMQVTKQMVHTTTQRIANGIHIIRDHMAYTNAFRIADTNADLIRGFEAAIVYKTVNGITDETRYAKDGHYEHIIDPFRYALYILSQNKAPEQAINDARYDNNRTYRTGPSPNRSSRTGY